MSQNNNSIEKEKKETLSSIFISETEVQILDQLLLPNETKFIEIKNTQDSWLTINKMQVRGAPMIAVVALYGLKMEIFNSMSKFEKLNVEEYLKFVKEKSNYLKTSRPTAVNLSNDLDELNKYLINLSNKNEEKDDITVSRLTSETFRFIDNNYKEYAESATKISLNGADIILNHPNLKDKKSINVLTICNTGKLAMPGDGTALGIIREIFRRNKLNIIYIPETRPYNQGSRLTAFETVSDNLPGILISDSMIGILFQNKQIDCVIVGADRITKSGATANKIGTFTFSVLAKHHNIPFYIAAPESSIDFNMISGKDIQIEERPADELRKIKDIYISPKDVKVFNPSFDVTPPNNIEAIITEKGSFKFEKTLGFWKRLDYNQLEKLLKNANLFKQDEKLEISDIADGNLNLVYKIKGENSIYCLKQALPYVKCVGPEWELDLERIKFETSGLRYAEKIVSDLVPCFKHYDEDYFILVMEFLENHIILRKELISGEIVDNLGRVLGKYIAKTCFYSSNIHLSPKDFRKQMNFWNQNTLCELTEKVIFSDPYVESNYNRWTKPFLNEIVQEIKNDPFIISSISKLREKFICKKQALIHADLHTGSIMVNRIKQSIKIIDPEFMFVGPIGFDFGILIANLLMSYFSKNALVKTLDLRDLDKIRKYQEYLLNEVEQVWESFKIHFVELWSDKNNRFDDFPGLFENDKNELALKTIQNEFFTDILEDTVGFTAVEIIRRITGIAHNADFETIENLELKAYSEKKALKLAIGLIKDVKSFKNINDIINLSIIINDE